jgi:hypothetical protein
LNMRAACWPLIMELMEGMKAKARCSLRLLRGTNTNKVLIFWIVYMYVIN